MDTVSGDALKLEVKLLESMNYYSLLNEMEVVLRRKGAWKFDDPSSSLVQQR